MKAAAARGLSPGGALLRTSRLFALPAAIPPPPGAISEHTTYKQSDTATQAFPTHQVITTLSSSRQKGDWGLKRPLPLKSTTKSTNPMLRVKAIDTIESITDFTSGADHGLTLRKFQELSLPLFAPQHKNDVRKMGLQPKSVFEDDGDVTALDSLEKIETRDVRWKFGGPWLSGMNTAEFKRWLVHAIRPKRAEFRRFLKAKLAVELLQPARERALDNGIEENGTELPQAIDPDSIADEQYNLYLRKLRSDLPELYHMVGVFLDLAPLQPPIQWSVETASSTTEKEPVSHTLRHIGSPYAESGPPPTHPSAGLSYLRTATYMENHPMYGPQLKHTPVQARVLSPRRPGRYDPVVGVAGFVAKTPRGDSISNQKKSKTHLHLERLDPSIAGGAKIWVHPQHAEITPIGQVRIQLADARNEDSMIVQELLGEAKVFGEVKQPEPAPTWSAENIRKRFSRQLYTSPPVMSSSDRYGMGAHSLGGKGYST
ncbi:mitochondrial ribosomal protein MRP51 [Podospora didyma]|uniref:Mitochondrial ribosomal protein MRP51 n=1 Tax=Podospora didyma TaxID=330526 RepID=A0AAE0NZ99_9PEZI|nr:mitochondrial ribosomal protein MRP51 [Podospora didyma]